MRIRLQGKVHSRRGERGMTMIELMIAMTVLAVGLLALMGLIVRAIGTNTSNQFDTGATLAAQAVLETIAAQPDGKPVSLTDCAGNTNQISTLPNNSVLLQNDGQVNFTQNRAAIANGYTILYVACGAGGRTSTYDVRWYIQTIAGGGVNPYSEQLVVVGAAQSQVSAAQGTASQARFTRPVTLRTISATGN